MPYLQAIELIQDEQDQLEHLANMQSIGEKGNVHKPYCGCHKVKQ